MTKQLVLELEGLSVIPVYKTTVTMLYFKTHIQSQASDDQKPHPFSVPEQGGAVTGRRGCKQLLRSDYSASFLTKMIDVRAWAEYVVEWAAKDPYGFLTTVILALTPLFIASALLSWKLAKMIEVRDREQKKKQKRQENIAKAKRTKKD
ncbi:small integral membrane protein 15 [Solea senegalensis]|uniref:Small integral membrane protein 15 n=2 Tax=Euteleosteomorpha TaxID=1489388 RepID=A0AAV6QH96_SOLSE|nr:small integral membrane protein 15 [Solea senegalensis]